MQFSYLQFLDLMTTVAFLIHGVQEANPLVRFALRLGPNPLSGLLLVKCLALSLGVYCWRCGREKLLTRMNFLFALVVAWNVTALILGGIKPA